MQGQAERQTLHNIAAVHRTEIPLSGFSGARVLLIREGQRLPFVRKISANPAGNSRLQLQAAKQKLSAGLLDGVATTPRILEEGEIEGLYYFDMEYIRGLDGISFLRAANFEDINSFVLRLSESLKRFSELRDVSSLISLQAKAGRKCEEILAGIPAVDARAGRLLENLIGWVDRLVLPHVPVTACHGDMTLENIVVTKSGEIVFIDLLDSFCDHCLADLAKLDQDLRGGWYTRKSSPLPISLVQHVRSRLALLAKDLYPDIAHIAPLLVCVHFARIIPYTRNEAERDFVLDRLEYLVGSLQYDGLLSEGILA